MTLLEVLIAGAVFGLFLTMVSHALVLAARNRAVVEEDAQALRRAAVAVEWLGRELRLCQKLYVPDPGAAGFAFEAPYRPEAGATAPWIFRRYDHATGKDTVVGFTYVRSDRSLRRLVYDPGFDPADPASQGLQQERTTAEKVDSFELVPLDPALHNGVQLVRIRVDLEKVDPPPQLEVKVGKL